MVTWTVETDGTKKSATTQSQPVDWISLGVTPRNVASNCHLGATTRMTVGTTATKKIAVRLIFMQCNSTQRCIFCGDSCAVELLRSINEIP